MKTTNKFAPETRKSLVKAIGEILQTKPTYLGMPSAAYEIGEYHIAKDGTMTGPDSLNLMIGLAERGFEPEPDRTFHLITPRGTLLIQERFDTAEGAEAAGYGYYFDQENRGIYIKPAPNGKTEHSKHFAVVGAPFEEAVAKEAQEADPAEETREAADPKADEVVIEIPLEGFTPQALDNLSKMVTAKEELIKLAFGARELPIQVLSDRLAFPWLTTADPEMVDAAATFIATLCKTAKEKKRVTATPQPTGINDRYRFRCFMLHIGMIGSEYAAARTKLMAPLSGNSGWLNGPPPKAEPADPAPEIDHAADIPAEEVQLAPEDQADLMDEIPAEAAAE